MAHMLLPPVGASALASSPSGDAGGGAVCASDFDKFRTDTHEHLNNEAGASASDLEVDVDVDLDSHTLATDGWRRNKAKAAVGRGCLATRAAVGGINLSTPSRLLHARAHSLSSMGFVPLAAAWQKAKPTATETTATETATTTTATTTTARAICNS